MTTDERVAAHVARFNDAVTTGDWAAFASTFGEDAVMRFVNVPAGPYLGRKAIAAAYAAQPPDDTMIVTRIDETAPDAATAKFTWSRGSTGVMIVRWADGLIAELSVEFT
jgi:steroid Delta-isomerase